MAVRGFDVFDQMAAAAVLPQPAPQPTAQSVAQTAPTAQRAPARTLRAGAYLLTYAGALLLAVLATFTPLDAIDADIGWPLVAVTVVVLVAIVWGAVWG